MPAASAGLTETRAEMNSKKHEPEHEIKPNVCVRQNDKLSHHTLPTINKRVIIVLRTGAMMFGPM